MYKNRIKKILLIFLLLNVNIIYSQDQNVEYNVNATFSLGYSFFASSISTNKLNRFQPNASLKIMWKPEHLLSIGIESGYLMLYSLEKDAFYNEDFGTTDVKINMTSVPIFLSFSMNIINNIDITGGIGGYLLLTDISAFDNEVRSTGWSTGYQFGVNYNFQFFRDLNFGTELKTFYISKLESASINLNVFVNYSIFTY